VRLDNPITATLAAVVDQLRGRRAPLGPDERLDGRCFLVTGATSGLGRATAAALAGRGARLLLPCRSAIASSAGVETLPVDLADLRSVVALCDGLRDRGARVDGAVLCAGVVPRRSRRTGDGFELMFQVNYLAHVLLTMRLLRDGVIPNRAFAGNGGGAPRPRLVIVSSESHRNAAAIDPRTLGDPVDYGMLDGMAQYARTKLLLCTFACELARRLDGDVAVHALCPGAVDSNLAREAPAWVKPVLRPVMKLFFASPERAARPVAYLAASSALEGRTGIYMHMARETLSSERARDPEAARRLFDASVELLARAGVLTPPANDP